MELEERLQDVRRDLLAVERAVGTVVVGQEEVIRQMLTSVVAGGHILTEGLPGLGKTLMVKTLKDVLDLSYSRIQFTPDLMPADITGTNVIDVAEGGTKAFRFEPGPIFANLLLADEINRASPKTQAALLQAMQEHEVTAFGKHHPLEEPFIAIATQNPIELEGTYPLPEAQLDRFLFKVTVPQPDVDDLVEIARRTTAESLSSPEAVIGRRRLLEMRDLVRRIPVALPLMQRTARLVLMTHPSRTDSPEGVRMNVRYGASPRGVQALIAAAKVSAAVDGRFNVSWEDILLHLLPALRHRVVLNFEGELRKVQVDQLLQEIAREASRR